MLIVGVKERDDRTVSTMTLAATTSTGGDHSSDKFLVGRWIASPAPD
jgi:hypothetical protein